MASNFDCDLDDYRFTERDHPLIYSVRLPGFAEAIGLKPESADDELIIDTFLTSLAWSGEAEKALSYSRHRGKYARSRYRPPAFTYKTAMRVVEQIKRAGLALENRTLPGHRGRQSILTATPELMTAWRRIGLDPIHDSNAETIILKARDEERRYLEYIDSSVIRAMRESLRPIREMLNSLQTEVPSGIKIGKDLLMFEKLAFDDYDRPFVKRHYVRMHRGVRRIFTGNFKQHGRLYCAHQNVPSDARQTMLINGESVTELDFSAMHPTLLHNIAGVTMDRDPYDIGGGFKREHVKLALLIVINSADPASAVRALAWHGRKRKLDITHELAKAIVSAILERLEPIRRMLCSDWGVKLMHLDAIIMLAVMQALVTRGIPAIPVHDSIIVPRRFADQAEAEMAKSWAQHAKGPNLCNIKRKVAIIPQVVLSASPPPSSTPPPPVRTAA